MKKFLLLLLLLPLVLSCSNSNTKQPKIETIGDAIVRISEQPRIYSSELSCHKDVSGETIDKMIFGVTKPFSKNNFHFKVYGFYKAYIDFSDFSDKNIKEKDSLIYVQLPMPRIELISAEVDHTHEQFNKELFASDIPDKQYQDLVNSSVESMWSTLAKDKILDQAILEAQQSAQKLLIDMFRQMGYKNIKVEGSPIDKTNISKYLDFSKYKKNLK